MEQEAAAEGLILPAAVCAVIAGLGLIIEFHYDSFEFFKNGGAIALVGAVGCGLVAWVGQESHPVAFASSVILGVAGIGAFVAAQGDGQTIDELVQSGVDMNTRVGREA